MKDLPMGAESGPSYPDTRVDVPDGWRTEILPLSFSRARVIVTDGLSISHFW